MAASFVPDARRIPVLLVALALAVVAVACGDDGESDDQSARTGDAAAGFFFAQTATSGALGEDRLVLEDVSASVLAISVEPLRSVERVPVAEFSSGWSERFGDERPNAVLTALVDGEERDVALELGAPTVDPASSRIEYPVEAIGSSPLPMWEVGRASLFIDPAPVGYTVTAQQGGSPIARLELDVVANVEVTVTSGPQPGELDLDSEDAELEGYFQVRNLSSETIEVEILMGERIVTSTHIPEDATWSWQP